MCSKQYIICHQRNLVILFADSKFLYTLKSCHYHCCSHINYGYPVLWDQNGIGLNLICVCSRVFFKSSLIWSSWFYCLSSVGDCLSEMCGGVHFWCDVPLCEVSSQWFHAPEMSPAWGSMKARGSQTYTFQQRKQFKITTASIGFTVIGDFLLADIC